MRDKKKKMFIIPILALFLSLLSISYSNSEFIQPLSGAIIVIDSGMGAEIIPSGTIDDSEREKLAAKESKINARISYQLKILLEQAGAKVFMTSSGETAEKRIEVAAQNNPHFILSIHHNYSKNDEVDFVTVFYGNANKELVFSLASNISKSLSTTIKNENIGAQYLEHPLLKNTQIPTAVIACSFITKKDRFKTIDTIEGARQESLGILHGVIKFWEEKKVKLTKEEAPITIGDISITQPTTTIQPAQKETMSFPPPPSIKEASSAPPPPPVTIDTPSKSDETIKQEQKPFTPAFVNPVDAPFDQTWLYGESYRNLPTKKSSSFNVPEDTNVLAVADGEVIEDSNSGKNTNISMYPNFILIKHFELLNGEEIYTLYGNMKTTSVKKGEKVMKGQTVGKTNKPYAASSDRATEFEFEIRIGGKGYENIRNPELYIKPVTSGTGMIVGRIKDKNGVYMYKQKITGAVKPSICASYAYSLTYGPEIPISGDFKENLVISDVEQGNYTLTTDFGNINVEVKSGMITLIDWTMKN